MDTNKEQKQYDSTNLIVFALRKWKPIIAITFLGAVISIAASLMITPMFKSSVILFPATSGSVSKSLLSETMGTKDIMEFGGEEEVEQMMQVLQSDDIRDKIIDKFHLAEHYDIDMSSKYPMTKLHQEYNSNISIERTQFMSIRIVVLDKDPELAAKIANNISAYVDTVMNTIKRKRALKALKIVESKYNELSDEIEELEGKLKKIREKGINNYESQSEVFNDAYATALAEGRPTRKLEEKLSVLSEYGGEYVKLRDRLQFANKRYSELRDKYVQAQVDANQNMPNKFVVDHAVVAEKKAYPIRWLIVVASTIATFILSILLLLIIDSLKKLNIL